MRRVAHDHPGSTRGSVLNSHAVSVNPVQMAPDNCETLLRFRDVSANLRQDGGCGGGAFGSGNRVQARRERGEADLIRRGAVLSKAHPRPRIVRFWCNVAKAAAAARWSPWSSAYHTTNSRACRTL